MADMLIHSRTKRYDIPLGHLDHEYIKNCKDIKEIERILKILRSGEEGSYQGLENLAECRLEELDPQNILLRKTTPVPSFKDIDKEERNCLDSDLKHWTANMKDIENSLKKNPNLVTEDDSSLPPVRGEGVTITKDGEVKEKKNVQKKVLPRDYKDWEKFDLDKELEKVDKEDEERKVVKPAGKAVKGLDPRIDATGLTEEEKIRRAAMEKEKGNEAFNSGDYEESILYYSRSLSLVEQPASFNNRALAYLKQSKWDYALNDLKNVLKDEPDNIKALLRIGTAYKGKKCFEEAKKCFRRVLKLESNNKRAESLLAELEKEEKKYKAEKEERKVKGHRMKIEDVSDSEEIEAEQNIDTKVQETNIVPEADTVVKGNRHSVKENNTSRGQAGRETAAKQSVGKAGSKDIWQDDDLTEEKTESTNCNQAETTNHLSEKTVNATSKVDDVVDKSVAASVEEPQQFLSRPVFYQYPMPAVCSKLREEGNSLFRAGQYAQAADKYSLAIKKFGKANEETVVGLSLIYSNLAACEFKTGNCAAAVRNSTKALEMIPHSVKPLLRRAAAYEAIERYDKAYVDFKHIISLDVSIAQAHTGASRCQQALNVKFGSAWREKIPPLVKVNPWEIPQIVEIGSDGKKPPLPSQTQRASQTGTGPSQAAGKSVQVDSNSAETVISDGTENDSAESCVECPDPEGCFLQLKSQGNDFVQKNNFKEAIECYTKCIDIFPNKAVGYTNRALCHLRLNQAAPAQEDCCRALEIEENNTKALYRRAQARKMLEQYKESLQDLFTLLKMEPNNVAAKKEVEIVKKYYKEELEKAKSQTTKTTPPAKEQKQRKRMNIEEVDDDDDADVKITKKSESKDSTAKVEPVDSKSATKENKPGVTPAAADPANQPSKKSKHKSKSSKTTTSGLPTAPPTAPPTVPPPTVPKLEKASPYEFIQAWNALKRSQGIGAYAELLRKVSPDELPRVISKHFDGSMLQTITACVKNEFIKKNDYDRGYKILFHLCKVARFGTVSMFMTKPEKKEMRDILNNLASHKSEIYSETDINHLREKYSVQ